MALRLVCTYIFLLLILLGILRLIFEEMSNINQGVYFRTCRMSKDNPFHIRADENRTRHSIRERYMGYGDYRKCQENTFKNNLTALLLKWKYLAKRNNISWVLFYGSLLGALRNEDIIPYDSDIDVLIDGTSFPVLRTIASARDFSFGKDYRTRLILVPDDKKEASKRRHITCDGKVKNSMVDECSFTDPIGRLIRGNLHIDLYPYYTKPAHVEDNSESVMKRYKVQDFYPFQDCLFLGVLCKCPENPWKLLYQYFQTTDLAPKKVCHQGKWVEPHTYRYLNVFCKLFKLADDKVEETTGF